MSRLVFGSSWEVEIVGDEHVLLLSERCTRLLTGWAYVALARGLAQGRSVYEIIDSASGKVTAAEIFYALDRLQSLAVVRDADEESSPSVQGFWDSLGVDPAAAWQRIRQSRVTLLAIGDGVSTDRVASSLGAIGIRIEEEGDFFVVLTDDYLRPDLESVNQKFLHRGSPWVMARTSGSILWLGPLLRPGRGCWECMADRLRTHRQAETFVQSVNSASYPRAIANYALPSSELAAASLLVTEIAKSLVEAPNCQLENVLLTFDLATVTINRHVVVRRPQCSACGDAASFSTRMPEPVRLVNRAKTFSSDGGHRDSSPEQTLARYAHHISPLTGVVRELTIPAGTDSIAPMYLSGPNAAAAGDTVHSLRQHFRASTAGKGKTDSQAKASALCEAIERHSGIYQGNESRIRASYESLLGAAIDPNACMRYSAAQYARRLEEPANRFARVPLPFDEQAEIEWSPLWSLTDETFKYLPTAYCYFEYKASEEERFCWSDSNGCAAGNSPEEAILQGFLELAERDSVALWWYNQVARPAVDLTSFDDPYFAALTKYYRSLNRDIWVLDITTDLGIPSFVAISRRTDVPSEDIIFGFGAHLEAKIGVLRALTETNQFLPAIIDRHTDPSAGYRVSDEDIRDWLNTSTLSNRPFLAPSEGLTISAEDYPNLQYGDLKDEVEHCVRIATAHGLETLVLDQTRPDIGLPVFRVVVPGLRHFWPRFAPGRLYDVPVKLRWLDAPLREDELNPIVVSF